MQTATFDLPELMGALKFARRAIQRRNTIPVLGLARLTFNDGELWVSATDLDIELKARAAYSGDMHEKSYMVDLRTVISVFSSVPKDSALTLEETGNEARALRITCGDIKLAISTSIDAGDYPELAFNAPTEKGDKSSCKIGEDVLEEALRWASAFVSTEETRYYLNGICLDSREGGKLRFVATDGHRLIDYKTTIKAPKCKTRPNYILPRVAIGTIRSLLKKGGNRELSLNFSGLKMRIDLGDRVVMSKLIDGTFPDWTRVIPKETSEMSVTIPAGVAQRAAAMSDQRSRALDIYPTEGLVRFSMLDGDALENKIPVGKGPKTAKAPIEGEAVKPPKVGFNAMYLSILAKMFGDLELKGNTAGDPALIEPKKGVRVVLMPMRV